MQSSGRGSPPKRWDSSCVFRAEEVGEFFVRGKRAFVMYLDNHHGDGRLAIWCAALPEIQRMLVGAAPQHYFVPRMSARHLTPRGFRDAESLSGGSLGSLRVPVS